MTQHAVYIGNTAEAFGGPLSRLSSEQRYRQIALESALSQRSLYWGGGNKTVVTSEPIPNWLVASAARALHWSNVRTLSVGNPLAMCKSLLGDNTERAELEATLRCGRAMLSPYCVTPEFLELIRTLRGAGYDPLVPEEPARDCEWIRDYFDSKVGFRVEAAKVLLDQSNVRMPEGYVCATGEEAIAVCNWFHSRGASCVIKANRGESGWGCFHVPVGQPRDIKLAQFARIREDPVWSREPFVVESYVIARAGQLAFPSVEAYVHAGGVDLLYWCLQLIGAAGFRGVIIEHNSMPTGLVEEMCVCAKRFGTHFGSRGYRGYFDVDFIVDRQGKIFALEANARRTGGTHVYDISLALQRLGRTAGCLLSEDGIRYQTSSDFEGAVSDLLFPMGDQHRGVFITQVSNNAPRFGYVAVGADSLDARDIQARLYKALEVDTLSC